MQLKSFSMVEYKELIEQGFPNRIECDTILSKYGILLPEEFEKSKVYSEIQNYKLFHLRILMNSIGLNKKDFKLGNSRVCFRPLKGYVLDEVLQPTEAYIIKVKTVYEKKLALLRRWPKMTNALISQNLHRTNIARIENSTEWSTPKPIRSPEQHKDCDQQDTTVSDDKEINTKKRKRNCSQKSVSKTKEKKPTQKRDTRPSAEKRFDGLEHFPAAESNLKRTRCKLENCTLRTNNYCIKCNVHLCIKPGKNCFLDFHKNKNDSIRVKKI